MVGLCLAGVLATASAPATEEQPTQLAGVTRVTGEHSASMPVHLAAPATLNALAVTLEGAGRIFGVVLHRDGAPAGATAFAVHINYCHSAGCTNPDFGGGQNFAFVAVPESDSQVGLFFEPSGTLPPGDYHLQLIADEHPVTVTIPLDGLGGEVELTPSGPSGSTMTIPAPDLRLPSPARALFSAGSSHLVGQFGGLHVGALWVDEPLPGEVNTAASCLFAGSPPALTGYQFPCPGGGEISIFPSGSQPVGPAQGLLGLHDRYRAILEFAGGTGPGLYSAGAYNDVAGPALEGHLQLVWMDFLA